MKKYTLLIFIIIILLTGCGGSDSKSELINDKSQVKESDYGKSNYDEVTFE